jgi:hypothetical protein
MKFLIPAALAAFLSPLFSAAQSTNDILVGGGSDLIKSDIREVFDKAQLGVEANYFVVRHFAVGAGAELWTGQHHSFVMGVRWYADDNFFARFRGLIGANDASLGVGWSKPILTDWRVEALGDFYFKGTFGLRAGVAYVIKIK